MKTPFSCMDFVYRVVSVSSLEFVVGHPSLHSPVTCARLIQYRCFSQVFDNMLLHVGRILHRVSASPRNNTKSPWSLIEEIVLYSAVYQQKLAFCTHSSNDLHKRIECNNLSPWASIWSRDILLFQLILLHFNQRGWFSSNDGWMLRWFGVRPTLGTPSWAN